MVYHSLILSQENGCSSCYSQSVRLDTLKTWSLKIYNCPPLREKVRLRLYNQRKQLGHQNGAYMKFSHSLATKFKMELICLKTEEAQRVFQARSAQQRKQILANILNITEVDEEDDFKTAILLDIYYDNLAFAVEQGFPWSQVCGFFHLVKDLMHSCTGMHSSKLDAE